MNTRLRNFLVMIVVDTMANTTVNTTPGDIIMIVATMFGGKTSYILHLMETASHKFREIHGEENKILYINHTSDTRSVEPFSTHSMSIDPEIAKKLNVDMYKFSSIKNARKAVDMTKYKLVCIDEAQFFDDLVEGSKYISENLGIDIYAAGLRGDSERRAFGKIWSLAPLADDIIILKDTFCKLCAKQGRSKKAVFTHRIDRTDRAQVQIGVSNYLPVCRKCYIENNKGIGST